MVGIDRVGAELVPSPKLDRHELRFQFGIGSAPLETEFVLENHSTLLRHRHHVRAETVGLRPHSPHNLRVTEELPPTIAFARANSGFFPVSTPIYVDEHHSFLLDQTVDLGVPDTYSPSAGYVPLMTVTRHFICFQLFDSLDSSLL